MATQEKRPAVPLWLDRKLKVEAGHRCAIPACRQAPVELAHIEPWSKVKKHGFENMIALCPNCHTRYDAGQIDRKSMRIYKANLTIINSRYGDLERRIIEIFARNPLVNIIELPGSLHILLMYLLADSLLAPLPGGNRVSVSAGDGSGEVTLTPLRYELTRKGREFVTRWTDASSELE